MEDERKQQLLARLDNFPLLRMLVLEKWLRVAVAAAVLLVIFLSLYLPRMWTVSPPGFVPVVKVRALNLTQAWSLKRAARQAMAEGRVDDADYAWRAAIEYNRADPETYRGFLQCDLRRDKLEPRQIGQMIGTAYWLLRLTQTNAADSALAVQLFERHQLYDHVLRVLVPRQDRLGADEETVLLKSLFNLGQIDAFVERWGKAVPAVRTNSSLILYHAAYLAGWGPPDQVESGRRELRAAAESPTQRVLANQLQMAVLAHLGEPDRYAEVLARQRELKADHLPEHIIHWRLLTSAGRKEEARKLAAAYDQKPEISGEVLRLTEAFLELGMNDRARTYLREYAPLFGGAEEIWTLYASMLMDARAWDELRSAALSIRAIPGVRDSLAGYSYYLEGRANLGNHRVPLAADAFQKVSQLLIPNRAQGLAAAKTLNQLGYPAVARDVLLNLEKELPTSTEFWETLFLAAFKLKDADLMSRAAGKVHELRPDDLVASNNYAAALLISRQRPEEAMKLTMQLVNASPNSAVARINHSLALLLGQRTREAEEILQTILPDRLTTEEAASYYSAKFEVYFNQKQYDRAWEMSDHIAAEYLFPIQAEWFERAKRQLPPRVAAR